LGERGGGGLLDMLSPMDGMVVGINNAEPEMIRSLGAKRIQPTLLGGTAKVANQCSFTGSIQGCGNMARWWWWYVSPQ